MVKIKAYKIDSINKTIYEVDIECEENLEDINDEVEKSLCNKLNCEIENLISSNINNHEKNKIYIYSSNLKNNNFFFHNSEKIYGDGYVIMRNKNYETITITLDVFELYDLFYFDEKDHEIKKLIKNYINKIPQNFEINNLSQKEEFQILSSIANKCKLLDASNYIKRNLIKE